MSHKVLLISLLSAFIVGCGSGRSNIEPDAGSNGTATISGVAIVGKHCPRQFLTLMVSKQERTLISGISMALR